MTAITRKSARRSKKPRTAPSSKTPSTLTSSISHPYLGKREISAIEDWNDGIPPKKAKANLEEDPVVKAYMQEKMALFHNISVKERKGDVSLATSQG